MRKQEKPAFGVCGSSLPMRRLQEGASKNGVIIVMTSRASEGWDAATFGIYRFEGGLTGEQSRSIRLFVLSDE